MYCGPKYVDQKVHYSCQAEGYVPDTVGAPVTECIKKKCPALSVTGATSTCNGNVEIDGFCTVTCNPDYETASDSYDWCAAIKVALSLLLKKKA